MDIEQPASGRGSGVGDGGSSHAGNGGGGAGNGGGSGKQKRRSKGRGIARRADSQDVIESLQSMVRASAGRERPAKSVEGWIVIVTNLHEEAQEDDVLDKFADYGEVKNIHLNLDRRTGFAKGYALLEFEARSEAEEAIEHMNDSDILGQKVAVDWAFVEGRR